MISTSRRGEDVEAIEEAEPVALRQPHVAHVHWPIGPVKHQHGSVELVREVSMRRNSDDVAVSIYIVYIDLFIIELSS